MTELLFTVVVLLIISIVSVKFGIEIIVKYLYSINRINTEEYNSMIS